MRAKFVVAGSALVVVVGACGGSPTKPTEALTEQTVTEHFVFHYSAGDSVDAAWQETFHTWAIAELGVTPPKITYNKYRDRTQLSALTGQSPTNGYADQAANTVYSIWPHDAHEVVHVYSGPWGSPVALFVEGLAVAYTTNPPAGDFVAKWNGTPVHTAARQLRAAGTLLPIASIAETAAFRARSDGVTYPESGSFVRFLIDTEGVGAMRRLYGAMATTASLATVRNAFMGVYGYSLDEAESRWLRFLDAG
jgi:hypothetical protein